MPKPQAMPFGNGIVAKPAEKAKNEDFSIWRDTALRYGGYADEVGEFLTPYLGGLGKFMGYGLSTLYCLGDMGTTLPKKYMNAPPEMGRLEKSRKTMAEGLDLSLFHLVATLLVPPRIIGAVVESTDRVLDPASLQHAQQELMKAAGSAKTNPWQQFSHWVAKNKLAGETAVHNTLRPTIQKFIENQENSALTQNAQTLSNRFFKKAGPSLAKFVSANEKAATAYNRFMRIEALKDPEMVGKLQENVKFLNSRNPSLDSKKVANLLWLKPLPVLVGIAMVPLIAHPFDKLMLKFQDWTIRPLLGKNKWVRDANGKLKSVKNKAFWGGKPAAPDRIVFPPPNPAPLVMTAHYHKPGGKPHFTPLYPAYSGFKAQKSSKNSAFLPAAYPYTSVSANLIQ